MQQSQCFKNLITKFAAAGNDSVAFSVYDGQQVRSISYPQFAQDILKAAAYFKKQKISNQHIALIAPNSYQWVVTFFAITVSGNVAVLMNQDMPEDIMLWQWQKADVRVICGEDPDILKLGQQLPDVQCLALDQIEANEPLGLDSLCYASGDETVIMMFTSGTTGKSKVVEMTAANILYSIENFKEQYTLPGMDRVLTPIPFYHIFGLMSVIETLNFDYTVCIGRGVRYLFMDMAVLNPTVLNTVPSIVDSLAKLMKNSKTEAARQRYIGNSLQTIVYGGAALKESTSKFLMEMGLSISVTYGMTEICGTTTWGFFGRDPAGSVGKFRQYNRYRFQDGEILVSGPAVMKGYYKDEEETAAVIENGWLHTGDMGYCDEDGHLYLTGRKKNVIILSNGENVNPEELEATISSCANILESMVYGDGKGICADIYSDDPAAVEQYIRNYNAGVPMYRQIYKVNYSKEPLPKTGSGKIKRKENKL